MAAGERAWPVCAQGEVPTVVLPRFEMRWKKLKLKLKIIIFECFVSRPSGKELEVGVVGWGRCQAAARGGLCMCKGRCGGRGERENDLLGAH